MGMTHLELATNLIQIELIFKFLPQTGSDLQPILLIKQYNLKTKKFNTGMDKPNI